MKRPQKSAPSPGATLDLQLLEHRVRIASTDRRLLGDVARCFDAPLEGGPWNGRLPSIDLRITLAPAAGSPSPRRTLFDVASDPPGVLESCDSLEAGEPSRLTSALNLWAVRESRRYYVFHAGGVARNDRGILLPAPSGGGKSTLTAALIRRGFDLLSDEVGAIDAASGRLSAYCRALWLRPRSLAVLGLDESLGGELGGGHRVLSPADLGARRAGGSVIPVLVVCPRFEAGEPTRMERLRPGPAVVALMGSSCSQAQFKVEGLDLVIDLARRLPCYSLVHSDPDEAVAAIEDAFARALEEAP